MKSHYNSKVAIVYEATYIDWEICLFEIQGSCNTQLFLDVLAIGNTSKRLASVLSIQCGDAGLAVDVLGIVSLVKKIAGIFRKH